MVQSGKMWRLREENEDMYKRLDFIDGEVEDRTNYMKLEKERHRKMLAFTVSPIHVRN